MSTLTDSMSAAMSAAVSTEAALAQVRRDNDALKQRIAELEAAPKLPAPPPTVPPTPKPGSTILFAPKNLSDWRGRVIVGHLDNKSPGPNSITQLADGWIRSDAPWYSRPDGKGGTVTGKACVEHKLAGMTKGKVLFIDSEIRWITKDGPVPEFFLVDIETDDAQSTGFRAKTSAEGYHVIDKGKLGMPKSLLDANGRKGPQFDIRNAPHVAWEILLHPTDGYCRFLIDGMEAAYNAGIPTMGAVTPGKIQFLTANSTGRPQTVDFRNFIVAIGG